MQRIEPRKSLEQVKAEVMLLGSEYKYEQFAHVVKLSGPTLDDCKWFCADTMQPLGFVEVLRRVRSDVWDGMQKVSIGNRRR